MMMIVRWYGLVGFEQETWYEEKERANGDVRKEDDMNDAKKRGRVLGEVGLLMLRRLAGQGFPSHSFHTWCWSLYIEFIWRRDYDAIGKSVVVYNCSKDHPDKESFGFPCMWYPCIGYVGLSDMQPLEKEEPWKHSYELHPGKAEFQKADGPALTTSFLLFDPGHYMI